jgi:hypothetical protein
MKIAQVLPADKSKDVVLQAAVVITFDQEINISTLSEMSFLMSGPGQNGVMTPDSMTSTTQPAIQGREFIQGTFSFALDGQGRTVATFKPSKVLRPNITYNILISQDVKSATGSPLDADYGWSFTTGALNLKTPPVQNPLPAEVGRIEPDDLKVTPSATLNDDLHIIEIEFPDEVDPASVDTNQIKVKLEAFLEDPDVEVPDIQSVNVTVVGNKLHIEITPAA